MKAKLTIADFQAAAKLLKTGVAEVRAVTQVESGGNGFTADGRCIIRFEPHIFSRKTNGIYDKTHPNCSYPVWRLNNPTSVSHSWQLFKEAAALNPSAAVQSASWGLFQIMGFHYTNCDCASLGEFVKLMEASEADQLNLFCKFIINTGLDDELRAHDWPSFARQYNGAGFKKNKYDTKLADAYEQYT